MSFKKRIYYRVFPTEKLNFDYIKIDPKCNKIYVRHLQELSKSSMKREATYWEFASDGVFFNATQEQIYNEVNTDLLNNVVKGYNGIIITFGQTGTGKTFTTSGLHFSDQEFGIVPRIAKDLLEFKRSQPRNMKICIQMSYVELNNTYAVDLLKELPNSLEAYKCREVKKTIISNEYEALKCLFLGEGRKSFSDNNPEYLSNLCSSVVTFHITIKNMDLTNPTKLRSRIHVIDLVGNDSCAHVTKFPKNPKEIGCANVTKLQLEQFILCLTENLPEKVRVQQRMNVLLYYLDGDFSCENIFRFIGHFKANTSDVLVTLSMLRFGQIVQGLKSKIKQINFDVNEEVELEYLKKKLQSYEKEKHLNSVLLNQDLVSGLNQPRIIHLNNLIQDYLKGDAQEITVMNVADTQMVLKNLKETCNNCKNEVKKLQSENQVLLAQHHSEISLKHRGSRTSSQGSAIKISRKTSNVKSRDSISKEKTTSASIASEKRIVEDHTATGSVDIPYPKRKKSRSASSSGMKSAKELKGSSQSKKKSSNTSIKRQDSRSSVKSQDLRLPIPDVVPEKQEIWKQFTILGSYKERVEDYKNNERDVRNQFAEYIKEVNKLRSCKENVNKCSNDLIGAQTFRKFNSKDEFDEDGFLVISYAEKQCKESLEHALWTQEQQAEKVLKAQEELKFYLENRQNIVQKINEDFDQFSRDNYKVPSSTSHEIEEDLKEYTFNANLEHPEESLEETVEIAEIPQVPESRQTIRRLQKLMSQEIQKRISINNDKKHKWKNV